MHHPNPSRRAMNIRAGTVLSAFNHQRLETALQDTATIGIKPVDFPGMRHGDPDMVARGIKQTCRTIVAGNGRFLSILLAVKPGTNKATMDTHARRRCKDYFPKTVEW
jgi:hypothetical protein